MLTLDKEVVLFLSDQSAAQAMSSDYWTVQEIPTPSTPVDIQRMLLFTVKVLVLATLQ